MLPSHGDHGIGGSICLVRDHHFVLSIVEHRSDVVAHAAINTHVRADARDLLDRAHPVGGDPRFADDRAPRLDEHSGHRQPKTSHLFPHALHLDRHVLPDRRGHVGLCVPDPQPSAHVQISARKPKALVRLSDQLHQDLDGLPERIQLEDLTADVSVKPHQVKKRRLQRPADSFHRNPVDQPETELRVDLTGLDERVGVRLDPRGHTKKDLLGGPALFQQLGQERQLLEAVHHHEAHSAIQRQRQLLAGLVVPVEEDAVRGEPCLQGDVVLAPRRDVDRQTFLADKLIHCQGGQRLAGIDHLEISGMLAESLLVPAALVADGLLVVDHVPKRQTSSTTSQPPISSWPAESWAAVMG